MYLRRLASLAIILMLGGCVEAGDAPTVEGATDGRAAGTKPVDPSDPFNATRLRIDLKKFDGSLVAGTQDPALGATDCAMLGREDVDQKTFDWTLAGKEADGNESTVRFVRLKLTGASPTTLDIDVVLLNPAGKEIAAGISAEPNELVEFVSPGLDAGVYKLRVIACNLADIRFSLTAQADYHSL